MGSSLVLWFEFVLYGLDKPLHPLQIPLVERLNTFLLLVHDEQNGAQSLRRAFPVKFALNIVLEHLGFVLRLQQHLAITVLQFHESNLALRRQLGSAETEGQRTVRSG